ncbi:hypothetical protein LPJ61_000606 [Coemansia biformis]|uniref:Uncharacterized protein n=1 Tax=Coemansia biformis TaxID=1286918 RepID=A0A9W8CYW3_9FUNG|nr:hypothetical protein LPJ61_000606 [Coemansia biformis]
MAGVATQTAAAAQAGPVEDRRRAKSRGRHTAKLALAAGSQQRAPSRVVSGSGSHDATISDLQQRLEVMAREKMSLENAIEHEQERVFNQSRRLSSASNSMPLVVGTGPCGGGLAAAVASGAGAMSPRWPGSHSRSSSVSSFGAASVGSVGITETLKAEINSLRLRLSDAERELVSCYSQSQVYKKELVALRQRLGMRIDDLYLDDPVPSTIRSAVADASARPRRSQSVSSGASSASATPSLVRRGSTHQQEYFTMPPGSAIATAPRRIAQRPHSVLLSPRRSMEDSHLYGGGGGGPFTAGTSEPTSLFLPKVGTPTRTSRHIK